jgi:predicted Rossmann fold flavoprotein
MTKNHYCDVAVIGAGAAGLMAAGRAAEKGARVLLLERNREPGKKLMLTGGGRCNFTNINLAPERLVETFGPNGKFLYSGLNIFGVKETLEFFNRIGVPYYSEPSGRFFPKSDKSKDVVDGLMKWLRQNRVQWLFSEQVKAFQKESGRIVKVYSSSVTVEAHNYIICTGGKSFSATGSTGDGYKWAQAVGHTVNKTLPALCPVRLKERWLKKFAGITLKDAGLKLLDGSSVAAEGRGELVITHFGLSGPLLLNLSGRIAQLSETQTPRLRLDFTPWLDDKSLDDLLRKDFETHPARMPDNLVAELVPSRIAESLVNRAGIAPDTRAGQVSREQRQALVRALKSSEAAVSGLLGMDAAMVTAGGVSLKEIEPKTMRSKLVENLFFAGEVLDLDGPTGGYNLQVCWTTGRIAGDNACHGPNWDLKSKKNVSRGKNEKVRV